MAFIYHTPTAFCVCPWPVIWWSNVWCILHIDAQRPWMNGYILKSTRKIKTGQEKKLVTFHKIIINQNYTQRIASMPYGIQNSYLHDIKMHWNEITWILITCHSLDTSVTLSFWRWPVKKWNKFTFTIMLEVCSAASSYLECKFGHHHCGLWFLNIFEQFSLKETVDWVVTSAENVPCQCTLLLCQSGNCLDNDICLSIFSLVHFDGQDFKYNRHMVYVHRDTVCK